MNMGLESGIARKAYGVLDLFIRFYPIHPVKLFSFLILFRMLGRGTGFESADNIQPVEKDIYPRIRQTHPE
jgi:hypothetical protein